MHKRQQLISQGNDIVIVDAVNVPVFDARNFNYVRQWYGIQVSRNLE